MVYNAPVRCRQESQWQAHPSNGSFDFGTWVVKVLALQRQLAVNVTVSSEDAIGEVQVQRNVGKSLLRLHRDIPDGL